MSLPTLSSVLTGRRATCPEPRRAYVPAGFSYALETLATEKQTFG